MSIRNFGLAAMGAGFGVIGGNYLYNLDKKVNESNEVIVPFYTARKAATDLGKTVDSIKEKCQSKFKKCNQEDVDQVVEMTDEEVAAELQQDQAEVISAEETSCEQNVIDAEVVDGKAVPVDGAENPDSGEIQEQQTEEVQSQETKIVGNTEETTIPHFPVIDDNQEKDEPKETPKETKASQKATTKGSKAKATTK